VQRRPQLFAPRALFPDVMNGGEKQTHGYTSALHPENPLQVFVNLARALTLGAAGKQLPDLRLLDAPQDELIATASAAGAGFAVQIAADRSDLSFLFAHRRPPQKTWLIL